MSEQPREGGRTSEQPRIDMSGRHLVVSMALAGLVVVSLGVGFLAGYLTGGGRLGDSAAVPVAGSAVGRAPGAPPGQAGAVPAGEATAHGTLAAGEGGHTTGPGGTVTCVYDLPAKDQWILAGMTCVCNEPHCNRTPLLSCHCDTAHTMKALTKQLIVEGMKTDEIAAELEKRYGPGVVPKPAANPGAGAKAPGL